ncbi:hypothetical protein SprV_0702346200 [Sparganum proliferum]
MASFSAKHLHFVPFNINPVAGRSRLLAASPNGLIFGTRENDLVVFRAADYVGASAISTLRKDKPLDTLRPNIAIPFSRQITWLAVNSNGSLLSVCSSSTDGATFVQLLEISKMLPTENFGFLGQPLDLTRPEAGAETNCPSAGSAIADLAWSPVDSNRLAVATHSGSLRMFVCSGQDAQRPLTLVGSLPQTSQVKCISWSPKGKQLAVCLTGIIPNFPAVATTAILQLDPELRQKRVIPLSPILQSFSQFPQSRPIDMLWSSSYCFLVALEGPTPQHGTRVAFVSAQPKCEPRGALVEDLAGACESTAIQPFQYHMRLWPNSGSLVAATWSSGGETCVLLDVPALSTGGGGPPPDSLPKLLTEMVLPSTRAPIALAMSVVLKDAEVLPLLVTRLGDGIVCAYEMLQGPSADPAAFAGFRTWLQAAAPAPNLPPPAQPAPTSVQSPPPTTTTTTASPPAFVSSSTKGVASATATPPTAIFGGTVFGQQSVPNTSSATPTPPTAIFGGTVFGQQSVPNTSSATPTAPTAIFGGTVFGQQSVSTTSTLASATTNASTLFGGTVFGQQSVSTASTPASATTNASALFGGTVFGQQSPQNPQPTFPAPSSATAISTSNAVSAAQPASPVEAQIGATTAPTVTPSIFSSGGLFGSATSVGGQSTAPAQPAPTSVQSPPPTTTTTTASPPAFVSSSTKGVASATATPPTAIFGGTVFGQQSVPNTSSATPTPPTAIFGGTVFGQQSVPNTSSATPTAPTAIFGGTVFGQQSVSTTSTLASATTNASTLFGGTVFGQQSVSTASTPASATTNASALFGGTVFGQQSPQNPQPTFPAPSSATAISTSNAVSAAQPASPVEAQIGATTAPTVTPSIFSSGGLFGSATSVGGQSTGVPGFGAASFGRPPTPQPPPALSVSVANSGVGAAAVAQSAESGPLQSPTSPREADPVPL